MANFSGSHLLFFSFIIATGTLSVVSGTVFTIVNSCSFNVWPGVLTGNGAQLNDGGFLLTPGASVDLTAPAGWSGRIWGRTGCNFDGSGAGRCLTGDCGDCQNVGCVSDLNGSCPNELRVMDGGNVVACKSACAAFNKPEYCCTGAFDKPETSCPKAYSYAYDDASSTFTCTNANYSVVFCPRS
ncbi:BnaA06g13410D [Brassica napus]|uniref:BnaA06g13410D protein n=1 Tax=Brassica napus TaxID=3708 RepID=A0A078GMX1_BRANA|nr:BnaA06g13410D [Brassica napus]